MRENKKKKQRKVDVQSYINNVLKVEEENDGLRFKIKELEAQNQELKTENRILRRDYIQLMDVKDFYYRAEHQHGLFKIIKEQSEK